MNAEIDEFVEQVRLRSDIYTIVSGYVSLKFKNGRFWGRCPFHEDDAESFSVAPDKGFFYCFHCHIGGDALKFISMKKKISYFEAVKTQAEKLKISLPSRKKDFQIFELKQRKKTLFEINRLAADFYHEFLKKSDAGKNGRKYLEARGITSGAIEEFRLGFAPKNSDKLTNLLLEKKFTPEQLIESGLVLRQENGEKLVDRFQECVIIPAINVFGRVVGIGGRILESTAENDPSKLFDIPNNLVFDKESFIFGVKKPVRSLLIAKNYTDAVFLNGAGIKSVAAFSYEHLNEGHLRFLLKYAKKIIFCREKEKIEQEELTKILPIVKNFENEVFFVSIPENQSPQVFVRDNGKENFYEIVKNARSVFDCQLQNVLDQNAHSSPEEKVETLKKIFQIVSVEKNGEISEEYLKKFSDTLELGKDEILEEWKKFQSPLVEKKAVKVESTPKKLNSSEKSSQEDKSFYHLCVSILRTCWHEDGLLDFALALLPEESFSEVHREIVDYIKKSSDEEKRPDLSEAKDELSEKAYSELSKIVGGYDGELQDVDLEAFDDSVTTALKIYLQKSFDAKVQEAQEYLAKGDMDSYGKITQETNLLRKKIDELK
ncbi:MAG: hypothetical protein IJU55_01395 [Selenomonadaceae bacterium]|nr:hypothetical protein [Selenomonadaceae bacterium]